MNTTRFNKIFEERIKHCRTILGIKKLDYSTEEDRLKNFYDGAQFNEITPLQYAQILVTKHMVALKDRIRRKEEISEEFIDEKISDIINYMVLIEAINTKKEDKKTKVKKTKKSKK